MPKAKAADKAATDKSESSKEESQTQSNLHLIASEVSKIVATEVITREDKKQALAEQWVREGSLGGAEMSWLINEAGFANKAELDSFKTKVASRIRQQEVAGTAESREQFDKDLANLEAECKERLPDIEHMLADLKAEKQKLESSLTRMHHQRDQVQQALKHLADHCLPPHVHQDYSTRVSMLNATLRREILDLESELSHLELLTDPRKHPDEKSYVECVHRHDPKFTVDNIQGGWLRGRNVSPEWPAERIKLQAKMKPLKARIDELKPIYDAEMAELDKIREYWWR